MIQKRVALEENFHVGTQVHPEDVAALRDEGFTMLICNRPDGEEPGQPSASELAEAAEAAGMKFAQVSISHGIPPASVGNEVAALDAAGDGKVFAFCRSGTRSTLLWALAHHEKGRDIEELRGLAEAAGYSLSPIEHLL